MLAAYNEKSASVMLATPALYFSLYPQEFIDYAGDDSLLSPEEIQAGLKKALAANQALEEEARQRGILPGNPPESPNVATLPPRDSGRA